ncbi:MAG: 16S rRNA (uracil(1498)-N(3))-methyltransferase [Bacteroidales bacterium]|nr:16S rRNA (uracil(1498)-N(3))-methyltransferase [Bacteroidales bacterium]
MELFYSKNIADGGRTLDADESGHCVRVLRHRRGDTIHVVDGRGMLYRCTIVDDDPRAVLFDVDEWVENYGSHDYWLRMAVCPPKNTDRFEWFAEKATEIGVDVISPVFGDYSERKVFKPKRIERLLVSAAKQSHKGAIPQLDEATTVTEFLRQEHEGLKLICYCDEATGKVDIKTALAACLAGDAEARWEPAWLSGTRHAERPTLHQANAHPQGKPAITILIGPEGDFSRAEVALALERGWQPVSLGDSRLRIETAAIVATAAVYLTFSK